MHWVSHFFFFFFFKPDPDDITQLVVFQADVAWNKHWGGRDQKHKEVENLASRFANTENGCLSTWATRKTNILFSDSICLNVISTPYLLTRGFPICSLFYPFSIWFSRPLFGLFYCLYFPPVVDFARVYTQPIQDSFPDVFFLNNISHPLFVESWLIAMTWSRSGLTK